MRPLRFALVAFALALSLAFAGCSGGSRTLSPTPDDTATAPPAVSATPLPATPVPTLAPTSQPTPTPSAWPAVVVRKGPVSRRVVTLTFDAGADAGFAAQVLETLQSSGITAAFGMTGRWAEQNPDLVRRMVAEGHRLINHSYDHPSFTGLSTGKAPTSRKERLSQMERTEQVVLSLTGASTRPYFRPPYGDYDPSVLADVGSAGYRYAVMWTVDSLGWRGASVDAIVERCLSLAEPGAVYIFHVGSESQDAAALQRVIDGLRERGYGFVSLDEMVGGD